MATPTVLLTGSTGFIGGATLARLLELRPDCRVLLLARDRGPESAAERVRKSLARFVGAEQAAERAAPLLRGHSRRPHQPRESRRRATG